MNKDVVIMMPFGGGTTEARRRAVLQFLRLKYLIESKVEVSNEAGARVTYHVSQLYRVGPDVSFEVMSRLQEADIVIGLFTSISPNVTYEMAVRSLLRDELLLIVDDPKYLPLYLKGYAYARLYVTESQAKKESKKREAFDKEQEIRRQIELLAQAPEPELHLANKTKIPPVFEACIATYDLRLMRDLNIAFEELEQGRVRRQEFAQHLMHQLEPAELSESWVQYYPSSIVQINWLGKTGLNDTYRVEDLAGMPYISSCNQEFMNLYEIGALPKDPRQITREYLLDRLKGRVAPHDLEQYDADQTRLVTKIIFENKIARASVPIRFRSDLPADGYRGRDIRPLLIGRTVVGNVKRFHKMYLHVIYDDITALRALSPLQRDEALGVEPSLVFGDFETEAAARGAGI